MADFHNDLYRGVSSELPQLWLHVRVNLGIGLSRNVSLARGYIEPV